MKKFRFITIQKKHGIHFLTTLFLTATIVCLNVIYFSDIGKSDPSSSYSQTSVNTNHTQPLNKQAKLAIIIDDFGQNRNGVKEMMQIDRHLTFAVMPFLTFSQSDAELAHEKNYEVIVHMPMEATSGKLSWVGPRPILAAMSESEVQQIVVDAFENVPYAVGANIHMGSKAGDEERIISPILDYIKEKNLYFVDSRASRHPIAKKIADEKGILCYDRNVFLDGKKSKATIKKRLIQAGEIALSKGKAVAIGHVGTEGGKITAEAIAEMLPYFDNNNIHLCFVSELDD